MINEMNIGDILTFVASLIVAGVLIATLWNDRKKVNHQTKMDFAKFYDDFDGKLRDTDYKLRELDWKNYNKIYHHMITIIVTARHITKFYDKEKLEFELEYFRGWIKYALALTKKFPKEKQLTDGDQRYATELEIWCRKIETDRDKDPDPKMDEGMNWLAKDEGDLPLHVLIANKRGPEDGLPQNASDISPLDASHKDATIIQDELNRLKEDLDTLKKNINDL